MLNIFSLFPVVIKDLNLKWYCIPNGSQVIGILLNTENEAYYLDLEVGIYFILYSF